MALQGFYDIRTFECLSREMERSTFSYASIHYKESEHENQKKPSKKSKQKYPMTNVEPVTQ